ncbi:MAG TPA: hypothetical protein VGW38_23345 [Chloroflexota bacterium]|nr:hypothetical protein [Chloroflexota bacterium]
MRYAVTAVGAALMLAACEAQTDENVVAAAPTEKRPFAADLRSIAGDENVFAMIVPANASADELAAAAREHCGEREFCRVYGWMTESDAAKALPLTDREVSSQAFQYSHNRSTGFEQLTWDCERWPRENTAECFSRE